MDRLRSTRAMRQVVPLHASQVAVEALSEIAGASLRHPAAWAIAIPMRLIAALAAALAAAAAGLVFVVLLPVCGLASIAEAFTKASWRAARGAVRGCSRRGALSQD